MKPKDMIGLVSGDAKYVALWAQICMERQQKRDEWIKEMRDSGVEAAHPNDGWIDRDIQRITFCYPHFMDGVEVGSLVALGDEDDWIIVRITGEEETLWRYREDGPKWFTSRWFYEHIL